MFASACLSCSGWTDVLPLPAGWSCPSLDGNAMMGQFRRCRLDGLLGNLEMTRNGGRALGHSNGGGGVFRQHVHLKCRFSETSIFPGTGMPHLWRCGLLRRRATCRHGLHLLRVHGFNLLSDDLSCSARSSHSHCCSHPFACVLLTVWWMVQPGHDHEADS